MTAARTATRAGTRGGSGLQRTRDWALENLDSPLSVADLASHARLHPQTLARRWRDETGLPPFRWLTLARLERAKDLLEQTDLEPRSIARVCGMGTSSSFRSRFVRETGAPPARHRTAHRGH
ncbi:helix-turn-helix domain-containing protein [Quadrisphaera oryzae]|uniref:helix-turn-helix domain-containing protein n=1 Tax=Quadrisphaera TaxID=317661 RepID=UPI001645D83C|nr:helix-turn-helix transcriptional regulator [Quadrisphaera sp. RL12-1S]